MTNKILVTYATCTGSTAGVAEAIGKSLAEGGALVKVLPMQAVKELGCYLSSVQKCLHTGSFSFHPGLPPRWSYTLSTSL
jgi:menaquinone-dependent protoporphyrinogen IX oxidase